MKSILESGRKEAKKTRKAEVTDKDKELQSILGSHKTIIKIVGVGGAGNNTLSRLMEIGVKEVETIVTNTDVQDLLYAKANYKILIGKNITKGLGAGSNPQIGEESARENEKDLREILEGSDMVFVTCGLGGGTGTGAAPVVAEIAKSIGALTISIVTLPFTEEGTMRWDNAKVGLEKIRQNSDTVIIVQNDKLLEIAPDLPLDAAFKVADEVLVNAVKGITELVTEKGMVNLDFADIKAIMQSGGTAMIGIGESESENRALDAIEGAIKNPLLDIDITGAKSALINITGGKSMSLKDSKTIMKILSQKLDPTAHVIWGAKMDDSLNETVRVMLIVTGIKSPQEMDEISKALEEDSFLIESLSETKTNIKAEMTSHELSKQSFSRFKENHSTKSGEKIPKEELIEDKISEEERYSEDFEREEDLLNDNRENENEIYVEAFNDYIGERTNNIDKNFEKKEIIDIKGSKSGAESKISDKSAKKEKRKSKKVFTEIFEEEARGDLNIICDAIFLLNNGKAEKKVLKDIKNSCDSLKNTAQLFTFEHIESFAESISSFIGFLIRQKFIPIQSLQKALEKVSDTINSLMYEEEDALEKAQEIQAKFQKIRHALEKQSQKKIDNTNPTRKILPERDLPKKGDEKK